MAYNVLEDMLWLELLKTLPATDQAEATHACVPCAQRCSSCSPRVESTRRH